MLEWTPTYPFNARPINRLQNDHNHDHGIGHGPEAVHAHAEPADNISDLRRRLNAMRRFATFMMARTLRAHRKAG